MADLKLVALDEEDLAVISAHCQDAVMKAGELVYQPQQKQFVIAMNRFVWEKKSSFFRRSQERRRTVLHFDRVMSAQRSGFDQTRPDEVKSLLAIRFAATDAPAGHIDLVFSGNATIRLAVECIEARLADLGAAWDTPNRPRHAV